MSSISLEKAKLQELVVGVFSLFLRGFVESLIFVDQPDFLSERILITGFYAHVNCRITVGKFGLSRALSRSIDREGRLLSVECIREIVIGGLAFRGQEKTMAGGVKVATNNQGIVRVSVPNSRGRLGLSGVKLKDIPRI